MKSICKWLIAAFAVVSLTGSSSHAAEEKITVFTSIVPQEYFVERIGGERVDVQALVKPGSSPATYEPSPRQMAALSEAKLYVRIGVPFENAFLPKIAETMKDLPIVDARNGIKLRKMKADHHHDEEHHGEGHDHEDKHEEAGHEDEGDHEGHAHHTEHGRHDEHAHEGEADHGEHHEGHGHDGHDHHGEGEEEHHHHEGGADPHIWLSPRLVKVQARTIADALIEVDPAGKAVYKKNLAAFLKDLDALDAKLKKALAPVKGKTLMVFHPAWGYFADAYGLKQMPVETEGKNPSARQLARVIDQAREEGVRVIFVQPQFSRTSADRVAEAIGGAVVPIDPLARDYIANLEAVAKKVGKALEKQG